MAAPSACIRPLSVFLAGYADDEAQYQALMAAGVSVAQEWQLIPGVALSAAQVAQLTTDIVWLVTETVTLPDGSTQQALVPRVYARLQDGDLAPSGALLAGNTGAASPTATKNPFVRRSKQN